MKQTFIYRYKNQNGDHEFRQLRFTHLVVDFTHNFITNKEHNCFPLKYAEAEVAGIGTFVWQTGGAYRRPVGSLDLCINEVYESVEDALNPKYKGYDRMYNGCFRFNGNIFTSGIINDNFYEKLPRFVHHNQKCFGTYHYSTLSTWVWDGSQAKEEGVEVFHDLIDGTNRCRLFSNYSRPCYATREECVNANHVKVFTF